MISTCFSQALSSVGDDVVAVFRNFPSPPVEQQEDEEEEKEEQEHVDVVLSLSVGLGVCTVCWPSVEGWGRRSNADVGRRMTSLVEIPSRR